MSGTRDIILSGTNGWRRVCESGVCPAACLVKNLILAMNGEKPIAQVNPEVPVKKVV